MLASHSRTKGWSSTKKMRRRTTGPEHVAAFKGRTPPLARRAWDRTIPQKKKRRQTRTLNVVVFDERCGANKSWHQRRAFPYTQIPIMLADAAGHLRLWFKTPC